jgi:hypothetical protein
MMKRPPAKCSLPANAHLAVDRDESDDTTKPSRSPNVGGKRRWISVKGSGFSLKGTGFSPYIKIANTSGFSPRGEVSFKVTHWPVSGTQHSDFSCWVPHPFRAVCGMGGNPRSRVTTYTMRNVTSRNRVCELPKWSSRPTSRRCSDSTTPATCAHKGFAQCDRRYVC